MPKDNANTMSTVCMEQDLLVVNDLKFNEKHYKSNLTYRKKDEWISEVASHEILHCVHDFHVFNTLDLPSDHASIALSPLW